MLAVTLHRCRLQFLKQPGNPCWRVEKALIESGVEYVRVAGDRAAVRAGTGQHLFPAIQLEDGSWYREESKDMAQRIREGGL